MVPAFVLFPAKLLFAKKRKNAVTAENILSVKNLCTAPRNAGKKPMSEKKESKCRIKAPSPEVCGYADWETVSKFAEEYPHLRPCPKHNWNWIYKTSCEKCSNKI